MRTPVRFGFALLVLGQLSCSEDKSPNLEEERRQLYSSWASEVILPLYGDFSAKTRVLDEKAQALCEAPSAVTLGSAQKAWESARRPWKQAEAFALGPYRDPPWLLGQIIDFWPVRVDSIQGVLGGTDPITKDSVAALGATELGMPVIEYLLFQPDVDLVSELSPDSRRCQYLVAATGALVEDAKALENAWSPDGENYVAELTKAGLKDAEYDSLVSVMSDFVNHMAFTIETDRSEKLGRPVGRTTDGTAAPEMCESQFSGRSIDDIRDNLTGVEDLFFGVANAEGKTHGGLDTYLRARGDDFGDEMRAALKKARAALDDIDMPLTEAVVQEPDKVNAAIDALNAPQLVIQTDVINALGLTVTFSDADGD